MGDQNMKTDAGLGQWKAPIFITMAIIAALPTWQTNFSAPETAALTANKPLIDESRNNVVIYAAPADSKHFIKISAFDGNGERQESELKLNGNLTEQSTKIIEAALSTERFIAKQ